MNNITTHEPFLYGILQLLLQECFVNYYFTISYENETPTELAYEGCRMRDEHDSQNHILKSEN